MIAYFTCLDLGSHFCLVFDLPCCIFFLFFHPSIEFELFSIPPRVHSLCRPALIGWVMT